MNTNLYEEDMNESNYSQKQKLNQSGSIEISDEEVAEVELSPVETIVWDCCEVRNIYDIHLNNGIHLVFTRLGVPREELRENTW